MQALYRKYRPAKFKEVLGQDHIIKALTGAIKEGQISHAYLFSGGRGTGKTSVARILAKELGTSEKDIYEIDAASNRGIDNIRELREAVATLPFESKYKIYIVDEVHMLTKEAFNALLKTLEEPPAHVIFILATTEIEKLLDTVISRCQVFTFKKPNREILKKMLGTVAEAEGYKLDAGSLDLISIMADGSYRDALGILQKVINASDDKKISLAEVEKITGAPKGEIVNAFVKALAEKNAEGGITSIKEAKSENVDIKTFMNLVLHKVRLAIILKNVPKMKDEIKEEVGEEDFKLLENFVGITDTGLNSKILSALLGAYELSGHSYIPEFPIELALIEIFAPQKSL
ncbi:MAG: DNA polymerase III subunit gamma/tau [Patescibacteria group bacterium]